MKATPASSRHLSAFAIDIRDELEQINLFSRITIKKTGLPECALSFICTLADESTTQKEVSAALERAWNEAPLGYHGGENSHEITASICGVQMQFATSTSEARITGRIEVIGFKPTPSSGQ